MDDDFERQTSPFVHELFVHCYRMLGSRLDAEDAMQETMLKAWRKWDSLHSPAALRAWLYRIATNVSLDMIGQRKRRFQVPFLGAPADPLAPLPAPTDDVDWLGPLPDDYLDTNKPGPAARYEVQESVNLAFLTLLQKLPGHQRAVLILRDVLGWKAGEAAELLEISTAAVNSSLQRARAVFSQAQPDWTSSLHSPSRDDQTSNVLARYQQAWEAADAARLAALLCEDARLSMPPLPAWYSGRENIVKFYQVQLIGGHPDGYFHLLPARANGCPAFAIYENKKRSGILPTALQVLSLTTGGIARIDSFINTDAGFYNSFGLPSSLTD